MEQAELKASVKAILGEYKKVINELIAVVKDLDQEMLTKVVDPITEDTDCKSIQNILTHTVQAGFNYIIYLEKHLGENKSFLSLSNYASAKEYTDQLNGMYGYCENFFKKNPSLEMEEKDPAKKFITRWGQQYDIEQLMEHAIVHVMRHRRQIEKYV